MLFPQVRNFLYTADDNSGNPTQTQEDNKGKTEPEKPRLFTQEEVDRIAAKEKREGKQSAEKGLLERLGVTNEDEIKALLEAKRKADETAKSAEDKLKEELAQKEKELLEAKQNAAIAEKRRLEAIRDNAIRNALLNAHNVNTAVLAFREENKQALEGLLDENGDVDTKELERLIAEFRAKNAYLFKGDSKGSPSNADGRLLKPDSEVKKELQSEIQRKLRW